MVAVPARQEFVPRFMNPGFEAPLDRIVPTWIRFEWWPVESHPRFVQRFSAFAVIAGPASRGQIVPGMKTPARAGDDVIEGEIVGHTTAVLTGEAIPGEHLTPREFDSRTRAADEIDESDHGREKEFLGCCRDYGIVVLEDFGFARKDKHDCPTTVADVQGFIVLIKDQDRAVHDDRHSLRSQLIERRPRTR